VSVIRSFGIQAIASSGASQPLFGTTLAAAGALSPDQFSGNTAPGSNQSLSYLPVNSSVGFRPGDHVAVGPKSYFVVPTYGSTPNYGLLDTGIIKEILSGSPDDTIVVQGLQNAHASGEYLVLNEPANIVKIIPRITTGILYIGNEETVSSTDRSVIDAIPIYGGTGAVPYFHESKVGSGANPFQTVEYWLRGTAADTFLAYWTETGG
jgi:hypothetical protein